MHRSVGERRGRRSWLVKVGNPSTQLQQILYILLRLDRWCDDPSVDHQDISIRKIVICVFHICCEDFADIFALVLSSALLDFLGSRLDRCSEKRHKELFIATFLPSTSSSQKTFFSSSSLLIVSSNFFFSWNMNYDYTANNRKLDAVFQVVRS